MTQPSNNGDWACPACESQTADPVGCPRCGLWSGGDPADLPATLDERIAETDNILNQWYRVRAYLGCIDDVEFLLVEHLEPEDSPLMIAKAVVSSEESEDGSASPVRDANEEPAIQTAGPESGGSSHETLITTDEENAILARLSLEYRVLLRSPPSAAPKLVDCFHEAGYCFLLHSLQSGTPLLKAWADPKYSRGRKLAWLERLRHSLSEFHDAGVVLAGLNCRQLLVDEDGQLVLRDLSGLARIPLSIPPRNEANIYAAPELSASPHQADFRSDAYSFGAVVMSLMLGRELNEDDFTVPGVPKTIIDLLPDASPPLVRLLGKTFVENPDLRFPSPNSFADDPTGFSELGEALAEYARSVGSVRYDIAGWTNTGMLRNHNEDAFTVKHVMNGTCEYRRDLALICVADGMGGHAAGEIASSLAVSTVAESLHQHGLSATLAKKWGANHPFDDVRRCADLLLQAVQEANRKILRSATKHPERAAMGCTIEALLLSGRQVAICHVGDSRVYHRTGEQLRQVTEDHTIVNRLIEEGRISPAQAHLHPRRAELSQAVGVRPKLTPDCFFLDLKEGDWIVACTDGLSNHLTEEDVSEVLDQSDSPDYVARTLINLANLRGGSDNATAVVVRVR